MWKAFNPIIINRHKGLTIHNTNYHSIKHDHYSVNIQLLYWPAESWVDHRLSMHWLWLDLSFCQKCRWQLVTAKHACIPYVCDFALYGVHRTRRHGSGFTWHQPCQRCKYVHHLGGYSKPRYKKLFTHVESHASAVSLLERRIALYKSDHQQQQHISEPVWPSGKALGW